MTTTESGISDFDRENVGEILSGYGDWFSARLLRLCQKADQVNLERLRRGFPEHVRLYEQWRDGEVVRG